MITETSERSSADLLEQFEQLLLSGTSKSSVRRFRQSLRKLDQRQKAILGITKVASEMSRVAGILDLQNLLSYALDQALKLVEAERGLLVLKDPTREDFEVKVAKHLDDEDADIGLSKSLLTKVIGTGETILTTNAQSDPRFAAQQSIMLNSIRSVMATPLQTPGGVIGAFYLDTQLSTRVFSEEDLPIISAFAGITASAIELARALDVRKAMYLESVKALVSAVEAKDAYTAGHSSRVGLYAQAIMRILGKSEAEAESALIAGYLHDVGKIGISDAHVVKAGPLSDEEWLEFKKHTLIGERILAHSSALKSILPAVRWHHEKLDGSGYPDGLTGLDIPIMARVIGVADSFDAMTSDRPYRASPGIAYALSELRRFSGRHYDPVVVEALEVALDRGTVAYLGKG